MFYQGHYGGLWLCCISPMPAAPRAARQCHECAHIHPHIHAHTHIHTRTHTHAHTHTHTCTHARAQKAWSRTLTALAVGAMARCLKVHNSSIYVFVTLVYCLWLMCLVCDSYTYREARFQASWLINMCVRDSYMLSGTDMYGLWLVYIHGGKVFSFVTHLIVSLSLICTICDPYVWFLTHIHTGKKGNVTNPRCWCTCI